MSDELDALRAQLDANLGLTPKPKPKPKPVALPVVEVPVAKPEKLIVAEPAKVKPQKDLSLKEAELIKKYPWIVKGKIRQDGGVYVTIQCVDCKKEREIHVQDAFQVKRCLECRGKKPKVKVTLESVKALADEIIKKETL